MQSRRAVPLTYEMPVNRLPNSKNLPENMNAAKCNSGRALPTGVSRKPPRRRFNLPHGVSSSAARRCATAEGDMTRDGNSKKRTVANRRCDEWGTVGLFGTMSATYPPGWKAPFAGMVRQYIGVLLPECLGPATEC